jgi:hypothetical protein
MRAEKRLGTDTNASIFLSEMNNGRAAMAMAAFCPTDDAVRKWFNPVAGRAAQR